MNQDFITWCTDSVPNFLGLFDLTIAPSLLFYAYIPTALIVIFFGYVIFSSEKKSLFGKWFFGFSLAFVAWIVTILIQWIGVPHWLIYRSWQATAIFEMAMVVMAVVLMYAYVSKINKDLFIPRVSQWVLLGISVITLVLVPTSLNIAYYDFTNCEGTIGLLWYGIYLFELISIIWVGFLGYCHMKKNIHHDERQKIVWFSTGLIIFLAFLAGSGIYGDVTLQYEMNLVGPFGMIVFISILLYLVTKYQMFNLKLFGVQTLVYVLLALMVSLIFVNDIDVIHGIIGVTAIFIAILGLLLIKSVKNEIKERHRLQQITRELEEVNKKLKSSDESKNEFLSFATHQLRSPLTSIKWGLNAINEVLIDKHADADSVKMVSHLTTTTDDMISTVNDLLDISKIEQGGLVLKQEYFDLYDMTARITEEFKITAQKKNLTLKLTGDIVSCVVYGDQNKLRQVVVNILDNAIKYTQRGGVTVSFSKNTPRVRIEIKDTGPGISDEELKNLFYKFTRGTAGKASQGGSGLGLYLAKKIIELHNGTIGATSQGPATGSTFFLELPII